MSKQYSVSEEKIERLIKFFDNKEPLVPAIINQLIPEYLEKNKPFCKIGQLLKRDQYPKNFYAIMKMKDLGETGIIRLVCITNSEIWSEYLRINDLKHYEHYNEVTNEEFKKLCGNQSVNSFSIYKP